MIAARLVLLQALRDASIADEVGYSYVGKTDAGSREYIFGGSRSDGSVTLSAMAGGERIKREESAEWNLHIQVVIPGEETHEASDARATEIGTAVENFLASNWTLGVAGLMKVTVTGWTLVGGNDDDGARSTLTYSLSFDFLLT